MLRLFYILCEFLVDSNCICLLSLLYLSRPIMSDGFVLLIRIRILYIVH